MESRCTAGRMALDRLLLSPEINAGGLVTRHFDPGAIGSGPEADSVGAHRLSKASMQQRPPDQADLVHHHITPSHHASHPLTFPNQLHIWAASSLPEIGRDCLERDAWSPDG